MEEAAKEQVSAEEMTEETYACPKIDFLRC